MNDTLQTVDLTKAELQLALSKEGLAYQNLLQECENVVFSRENLTEERTALVNLRKMKSKLEGMENPHTKAWADWNKAKKSLTDPVAELLNRKVNEYKTIAIVIEKENEAAEREKQRKAGILSEIDNFFINQSQAIAAATEPGELVRIEKLIGSHRSASKLYGEFLPLMAEKAANLTELIKSQKELLKKLEGLKTAENASQVAGDDQSVLDNREKQEEIAAKIEQNKIDAQEKSIGMATKADVVEPEIIVPVAPKARRSVWTWEVIDIKKTQKAMPNWVQMNVNVPMVDDYLKAKKVEGIEGEEFEFAGIKFYLNKSY